MNRSSGACYGCVHRACDPEEMPCYDCIDDDKFKDAAAEQRRRTMRPRRYLPWCSRPKRGVKRC